MVRKIQTGEYLKRYGNMTAAERQSYTERVGEWLHSGRGVLQARAEDADARMRNVLMASVMWNDAESEAFDEGARLLSALVGTSDTWLPERLYQMAVRRSIRQMGKCLKEVLTATEKHTPALPKEKPLLPLPKGGMKDEGGKMKEGNPPLPLSKENPPLPLPKGGSDSKPNPTMTGVPVRPKHIDQYVHLLPEKTQKRAGQVRELLRDLDVAREKARLLMDAGEQGDKVAQWAKKATQLDDKVLSIYRELDAEWEKLVQTGRVVVDAVGNVSVTPSPALPEGREDIPLTSEQKHRRRELRKWLIDTRRGAGGKAREKRIEQWKVNIKEYLTLEPIEAALKDEKIVAAAKHYGILLDEFKV